MRRMMLAGLAALLVGATPLAAQTMTSDEQRQVTRALDRGRVLYAYDRTAWLATDEMMAKHRSALGDAAGYIVLGPPAETQFVVYDKSKSRALYRASFRQGRLVEGVLTKAPDDALTAEESRLVKAREQALKSFVDAKVALCAKAQPNLAVLPSDSSEASYTAYLMTPQTNSSAVPLGGHYSVDIRKDGSASGVRKFMTSCMDAPVRGAAGKEVAPEAFVVSHLLDPTPTELHVFTSLSARLPIYVLTSDKRVWAVDGERIRLVKAP